MGADARARHVGATGGATDVDVDVDVDVDGASGASVEGATASPPSLHAAACIRRAATNTLGTEGMSLQPRFQCRDLDSCLPGTAREGSRTTETERLCRSPLQNAAARQWAAALAEPEAPSVDYLTGVGAGWEAGQVAALAMVVAMMTGDSATALIEDARSQAAMDTAFPFELFVQAA